MKKVDLTVIILNYNTQKLLRSCLMSISRAELEDYTMRVVVVDNASRDKSVEMLAKEFPLRGGGPKIKLRVRLLTNQENIGFAAGNNLGVPFARGRYILFLNPDTKVEKDTFANMIEFMDLYSRAGAATCRVELPDGKLDYPCHRGFPTPWNALTYFSGLAKLFPKIKLFSGYTLSYLPLDQVHEIDSASGSFLMVRKRAGDEINWWDEDYFWYGEDLDFCYRLKEKDWKVMFNPKTKITHYRGASSGIIKTSQKVTTATRMTRIKAVKASVEAMRIFYRKHYREKYHPLVYQSVLKGIGLLEKIRIYRFSR